jgi:uncharacterized protein YbjQ (UPF0145 family)
MQSMMLVAFTVLGGCDTPDVVRDGHQSLRAVEHEGHEEHEAHDEHDEHEEHEHARVRPSVSREAVEHVVVLESPDIGRATEVLGIVDAHEKMGHHDEALRDLREDAAALGADAVIGVEFHHGEAHGGPIHLSGMAVRFRDLRRDQPYDVLGKIDVAADMHNQEAAIHELKRRAGRMGADLIIDISYEHGDGDNKQVHLTGTAIRYRPALGRAFGMP